MNPSFNDYQVRARGFAVYKEAADKLVDEVQPAADSSKLRLVLYLMYSALGLASESGEVCGAVKKLMRDDGGQVSHERLTTLIKELGDSQWYLSDLCTLLRVALADVAVANIHKLRSRQERDQIGGDGDAR